MKPDNPVVVLLLNVRVPNGCIPGLRDGAACAEAVAAAASGVHALLVDRAAGKTTSGVTATALVQPGCATT